MDILTATLFLSLQPELWAGNSIKIGNGIFDIESRIETRIENFESNVFAFEPSKINYEITAGFNFNEYRIEFSENCDHFLDGAKIDTDIANEHSIKFIRRNFKEGAKR